MSFYIKIYIVLPRSFSLIFPILSCPAFLFDQNLKDEAATALEHLQEAESEAKALRSMTQRMVLTQEEMVRLLIIKLDL